MSHPKSVAIVGLGHSYEAYHRCILGSTKDEKPVPWEEAWVTTLGYSFLKHDKLFWMDDMSVDLQWNPVLMEPLKTHDKPIFTNVVYPEFPTAVRYPIREVARCIGNEYFTTVVSYMIAYAYYLGVKDLYLFGCDFTYPKTVGPDVELTPDEKGILGASYLLGMAEKFGARYHLPHSTELMDAYRSVVVDGELHRPMYGYISHPLIKRVEAAWDIQKADAQQIKYLKLESAKKKEVANG